VHTSSPTPVAPAQRGLYADRAPDGLGLASDPEGVSEEYSQWARNQRPQGNVYGGRSTAVPPVEDDALENSGSLTGQILAHGRLDPGPAKGSTAKVILIMLTVLVIMVVVTVIVAMVAGGKITDVLSG
jgi:hypothetical protein